MKAVAERDAVQLLKTALAHPETRRIGRFIVAGAVNTGLAVLVYQAALFVLPHTPAYVISYLAGIGIAYLLYSRHVFAAKFNALRFGAFVLFYSVSLAAGAGLNAFLIETVGVTERLAIFFTVAAMLPVNYFGSRRCLRAGEPQV
jgi:putative flippase GtrA